MKVRVLAVGGIKGPLRELADGYLKRARHYWRLEVIEVPAGKGGANAADEEAQRLLARIGPSDLVLALTREGTAISSPGFTTVLEDAALSSRSRVDFVIGGAFGLGEEVLARADRRFSLGLITLPHEFARVVLLEQLYRAGTIARGEPYHKGATRP